MHVANLNYWCNFELRAKEENDFYWTMKHTHHSTKKKWRKSPINLDWEKEEKKNDWIDYFSQQSNENRSSRIMNYDLIHKNVKCFKWNQQHKEHTQKQLYTIRYEIWILYLYNCNVIPFNNEQFCHLKSNSIYFDSIQSKLTVLLNYYLFSEWSFEWSQPSIRWLSNERINMQSSLQFKISITFSEQKSDDSSWKLNNFCYLPNGHLPIKPTTNITIQN